METKKHRQKAVRHVSSTEAIYKTIVNNQKIIHNLRKNIDYVLKVASQKKLDNISNRRNRTQFAKKSGPEELSDLADAFLQAKISNSEEEKPQLTKKMSPEVQKALKKYLSSSNVTTVRPTVVYSPSQSRLMSQTLLYSDRTADKKSSTPLRESVQTNEPTLEKGLTILRPNTIVKPIHAASPPVRLSSSDGNETKLIPIAKPQVTPGLVFEKLRLPDGSRNEPSKPKIVEQPKPSFLGFGQSFTAPASINQPVETEEVEDLSPGSSIACPSYEEITPPDSPTIRNRPIPPLDDTKILQVSLSRGVPTVQSTVLAPGFKKNLNLDTTYFEMPQGGKQQFPTPSLLASTLLQSTENVISSFGVPSSSSSFSITKPFTSSIVSDTALKSKAIVKPSATLFSFQPTSSASTAFSFSSKNDENKPTSFSQPSEDSKFSFNLSTILEPATSITSTLMSSENKIVSDANTCTSVTQPRFTISNILNPIATSASAIKPAVTLPQSVATSSSSFLAFGGQSSSLIDSQDLSQPKQLSFFQTPLGGKTPTSQSTSEGEAKEATSSLLITSVQSVKPQELATAGVTSEIGKGVATSFDLKKNPSSTPSIPFSNSQSAFNQSPTNLTQAKGSSSGLDSPLNLAGATSQSSTSVASKTFSLESIIASALDKKTTSSEQEDQTFKNLFSTETTTDSSGQQSTVVTSTADASTKSLFGQPVVSVTLTPTSSPATTTAATAFDKTSCTTSTTTVFGSAQTTTTSNFLFGSAAGTTVSTSVFGSTPTTTASSSIFGGAVNTTASSLVFGSAVNTTASTSVTDNTTTSSFGTTTTTTTTTTLDLSSAPTTTVSSSIFGQAPNTAVSASSLNPATTQASVFGQAPGTTPSFFGQAATTQSSFFGQTVGSKPSSIFGQATTPQSSSIFGQPATTEATTTKNQTFGTAVTTSAGPFTQSAGSFFSQPLGGQTSVFGSNATNAGGNTGFGEQTTASGFSFGKSTFGLQTTQGTFGLAKSVFGQNTPAFGQPASPSSGFGQTSGSGVFGQGSFFSGLGGKPSAENANKNVFGGGNLTSSTESTSIFGGSGASSFGAKTAVGGSFGSGSFSTGGGSVAQSGFGAFQPQTTPQKTGGFGSAPAFGAAPSFGSPPAFGSPPSFGSGSALGSVFGSSQTPTQTANFSNFASANAPSFGSLASQSPNAFGSPQQSQQPAFGQQATSPFGAAPVFGSAPAFGGTTGFGGGASSPPGSASAFTQWRN